MGAVPIALGKRVGAVPATVGLLVAWIVAYGLTHSWKNTFGYLFEWLGSKEIGIPLPRLPDVSIHPFGFLRTINRKVFNWLSDVTAVSERGFVYCLNLAVEPYLLLIGTVVALGLVTFEGIRALRHSIAHDTPKVVSETMVKPWTKRQQRAEVRQDSRIKTLTAQVASLGAHLHSIPITHAGGIAVALPRIGYTSKQLRRIKGRLGKLEKATAGLGAVALVTAALGRLGLGCLLGSKGKKAVGSLCKMDGRVLDALLLDVALIAVTFNIREFVDEMQTVTEDAASLIHKWAS